ncbi:hypothetical protein RRF57_010721 [Xylaria bambusicola]|uniref:Uncharacterized protein n=1 Tax=Xylaria bambusicola TaxID=326684 RepID=A0AAN7V1U7_9PEZI
MVGYVAGVSEHAGGRFRVVLPRFHVLEVEVFFEVERGQGEPRLAWSVPLEVGFETVSVFGGQRFSECLGVQECERLYDDTVGQAMAHADPESPVPESPGQPTRPFGISWVEVGDATERR